MANLNLDSPQNIRTLFPRISQETVSGKTSIRHSEGGAQNYKYEYYH